MMTMPELPLPTDRLVLRPFERTDLDGLERYYLLPESQRYLEPRARDKVEVKAALEQLRMQRRLTRPGEALVIAAERQSDAELVGHFSLRWTDATASQGELRFAFDPTHRKQGYETETLRAALDMAFEDLGLHRVLVRASGRNQSTVRLLKSLGLRLEAHFREHALFQGEWDEELHFAILDREWLKSAKVAEFNRHLVA